MIAHTREADQKEQSLRTHSQNVSRLCAEAAQTLGLEALGGLIGLLHDFGKGVADFQSYLRGTGSVHPKHASLGALYAWRRWFADGHSPEKRQAAQLVSLCIYGHHAGLPDCLEFHGASPYWQEMNSAPPEYTAEATESFYAEVASADELDERFAAACEELAKFGLAKCGLAKVSFEWGMLARLLLSMLVDADRWDTACFEYDADPFAPPGETPDWADLLCKLETYVDGLPGEGELAKIRRDVSGWCRDAGDRLGPGIYRLSVPTGGGKTFSSLRFALAQARKNGQQRIFYGIPMNTILDQNAQDIREALGGYPFLLEHHSNVVLENDEEQSHYYKLTERWNSPIILTSLVQILEALYRGGNSKARRAWRLANSVLIFDEIQALPPRCHDLFERAIRFLANRCRCTVLLCTATQPRLALEAEELIPDAGALYQKLKRVNFILQPQIRTYKKAACGIDALLQEEKSVLTIVNTKDAAQKTFEEILGRLRERDCASIQMQPGFSEEALARRADGCAENEILCAHLSTRMCPMHRKEILRWILAFLKRKKQVCCVSTSLVEAGINLSFPVVIRSLAGIPSMIQAAGRCNRNCESAAGDVYLWNFAEEQLSHLPEIKKGQENSLSLLANVESPDEMGMPGLSEKYFEKEKCSMSNLWRFPYPDWKTNLRALLSANLVCKQNACSQKDSPLPHLSELLCQSFRTAGKAFWVIEQNTRSVLIPYGDGKALLEKLSGRHTLCEELKWLREAQQYSVNLYENTFCELSEQKALYSLGETGAMALRQEYYNLQSGVVLTPAKMETLIV